MHAVTPFEASLYVPEAQSGHADAPGEGPYLPASHTAQLAAPVVAALCVPGTQAVHTKDVVAPTASPYVPTPQAVQPAVPVASALYVPAPHCRQLADEVAPVAVA